MAGLALAAHAYWQQNTVRVESHNMSRWTGFDDAQIVDAISELSQHRFIQFDRSKMAGRIEDDRIILKLLVPDEDAFAQGSRNGQRGK